jgi:hypothetical protein
MTDTGDREPPINQAFHPIPGQKVFLTATPQDLPPQPADLLTEGRHRRPVHGYAVISGMSHNDRAYGDGDVV